MNSKILLSVLVLVVFVAQPGVASPASILKALANIRFAAHEDLASRCAAYEKFLSQNPTNSAKNSGQIQELLQVLQASAIKPEAGQPESTLVDQLRECVELLAKRAAGGGEHTVVKPAHDDTKERVLPVTFNSAGLAKLSLKRQNVKSLALDKRCDAYEETLRVILVGQEVATESKPVLFRSVLRALAARRVPFQQQGQAPFVETLGECVSKLSVYQNEPSQQRKVVAGPGYQREPLGPVEVDPVESMRNEFNQVKKNVVDHGQDLYAGPKHGAAGQEDELKYRPDFHHQPSEIDNDSIDYNIDEDLAPPMPGQADFAIDSSERYRPKSHGHAPINQYIADDTYDELARKERDPVRKLELLLEAERRANKRLLQQLDDNQYQLGELHDQVAQLKRVLDQNKASSGNPLEESRLFEMKRLYEQASDRELKANEKYEHLLRKHQDLEARVLLERSMDDNKYADLDEDDDDDDDGDDDEHKKDWLKKERKELKKVNKEKVDKKKKTVEKTEDGDKIYRDPVDMARKLQNKMKSSEAPAARCQKYYALLNHPGKVTKKVLKTIAKLNLPKVASSQDPEYLKSLNYYADLLSRSDNKDAREASAEMKQCLQIGSHQHQHQAKQHQQVPFYAQDDLEYEYDPQVYANHYGGNHYQQQRPFRADTSPRKPAPSSSSFEIPVEFVTPKTNKRNVLSRGNSLKYAPAAAAYANARASPGGGNGASAFARFGPSSKLSEFQADHY